MSGIFDKYYKKYDNWYEKNEYAYLSEIKALKKGVPKKGKGVEIGVGTGRFAHKLGAKFGIDPSKNMLRIARRRGVGVKRGFGENLPYDDSFFDYALFIITICFI